MLASPPPIARPAPPRFLDGRRVEIRGESAAAILYAVDRLPASIDIDKTVVTVSANAGDPPTVSFWTVPNDGSWHAAFSLRVPADVARPPVVPWNAEPRYGAKLDPTLLGIDVHAMVAAFRMLHRPVDLPDYSVFIEQHVYLGRLEYGIGYSKLYFVCCVLRCDDQTTVDAQTMVAEHWRCVG
jgi:hypothetical protein